MKHPSTHLSWGAALAFIAAPLPLSAQSDRPAPAGDDEITFAAGVDSVVVDVVVTDRDDEPVPDLTAADFRVEEDGEPQAITVFEAVTVEESFAPRERPAIATNETGREVARRSFVLVFDDLNLTPNAAIRAREQLRSFVGNIFRPGDTVTVVPTAGGGSWTVRMPEGKDDLARVLERFQGRRRPDNSPDRISDYEAMRVHVYRDEEVVELVQRRLARAGMVTEGLGDERTTVQTLGVMDRAADVYEQARERTRVTLEALTRVLRSLAPVRGRKAVILVSQGFIYDTELVEFRGVAQASWVANANIYFLDAGGLQGLATAYGADSVGPRTIATFDEQRDQIRDLSNERRNASYEAEGSSALAADSGGFSVRTNDLSKGLHRIVRESRVYYLIGYEPTNRRRDGKFRKISVEVARQGVSVRARRGYYATDASPAGGDSGDAVDPALRATLESPYEQAAIPLRMTAYLLEPGDEETIRIVLAAEADPEALALEERGGRFADALQTVFQVTSRDSGLVWTKERRIELDLPPAVRQRMTRTWVPVAGSFDLPAGTYQARLLVRDERSDRAGTVRHQFEVPGAGALRVSTPILTDTFMAPQGDADPAPVPIARRRFEPGVDLVCVFDVFGARAGADSGPPQVVLRYGVRRADGPEAALHARGILPGPDGRLSQRINIPVHGAPPGGYEIVLRVEDELAGAVVERREAFEIEGPGVGATSGR